MLVYDNPQIIYAIKPDFQALRQQDHAVIVTARDDSGEFDFISRFFDVDEGVTEDPVTGSAHCTLAPYWADKLNKRNMVAYQASKRGGILYLDIIDDIVRIKGGVITVFDGRIRV